MPEIDGALDAIYNEHLINAQKGAANDAFETRVLKAMMLKVGLEDRIRPMLDETRQATGNSRISFAQFYEHYPDFPVWLKMHLIGYVHELHLRDLFNKFASLKFVNAWSEATDETPDNKPTALVFAFPGIKGRWLVCHNWDVDLEEVETRICTRIGYGRGQLVWIERFPSLLKNVMKVWSPAV